ncbi:MAG: family 6 glucosyltransferase [Bacteroidales bacterium]|jgi:hypothetical protein
MPSNLFNRKKKTKVGILYLCTGKYDLFFKKFYYTCEKYFLRNCEKHYFIFTDSKLHFPGNKRIHKIFQEHLGWPNMALKRYHIFINCLNLFEEFDYLFFCNANLVFINYIDEEILPKKEGLLAVKHPHSYGTERKDFLYEKNPLSTAYINDNEGEYYFMSGFIGGKTENFIELIKTIKQNTDKDLEKNIIAAWHDESHWNRYLIGKNAKILDYFYCAAEGMTTRNFTKIIIIDKRNYGGHKYLRQ